MVLALAITAVLGLALLVAGLWPRRAGTEPRCRRCLYNLEASSDRTLCPECGSSLASPKAICRGKPRRSARLALVGSLIALGAGTWLGQHAYSILTSPGWEHKVPAWWLAEVEVRFASGQRLIDTWTGLQSGTQQHRFSRAQSDRAGALALARVLRSPPPRPASAADGLLLQLAGEAESALRESPQETARFMSARVVLPTFQASHDSFGTTVGYDMNGLPSTDFWPTDWAVSASWRLVDSQGRQISWSGTTTLVNGGTQTSRKLHNHGDLKLGPPRCIWTIKVIPPSGIVLDQSEWTIEKTILEPEK